MESETRSKVDSIEAARPTTTPLSSSSLNGGTPSLEEATLPISHTFPPTTTTGVDQAEPPSEEVAPEADIMTPAMAVRMGLAQRLHQAVTEMGGARRRKVILAAVICVAGITGCSLILGLSKNDSCDRPFRAYLIMICVQVGLNFPFTLYEALVPRRPSLRDPPDRIAAAEAARHIGSPALDHQIRRASTLLSLFMIVLFILGNSWILPESTCRTTAPLLYRGGLVALILSWVFAAELIIIIIAVLFFLPILIILMRALGIGEPKAEVGPLSSAEIKKLPIRVFGGIAKAETTAPPDDPLWSSAVSAPLKLGAGTTSHDDVRTEAQSTNQTATPDIVSDSMPNMAVPGKPPSSDSVKMTTTRRWWRLLYSRRPTSKPVKDSSMPLPSLPSGVEYIILQESQSSCSICLCDYELPPSTRDTDRGSDWEPEHLRLLPCGHVFHLLCLDSWLAVSGRCPLCQTLACPDVKEGRRRGSSAA